MDVPHHRQDPDKKHLNNFEKIATRAGIYTPLSEQKPPKKTKPSFDFRKVQIPDNPMPHVLTITEWQFAYGWAVLKLRYRDVGDVMCHLGSPARDYPATYLNDTAKKLGLPDGRKSTFIKWFEDNPYEKLKEKYKAVDFKEIVIPPKPDTCARLSNLQWSLWYLCGYEGLSYKEATLRITTAELDRGLDLLIRAAHILGHGPGLGTAVDFSRKWAKDHPLSVTSTTIQNEDLKI